MARVEHTIEREVALGVDHFEGMGHSFEAIHFSITGSPSLEFVARRETGGRDLGTGGRDAARPGC